MQYAIEVHRLSKEIKGHVVLNEINLKVPAGKIYGLVGRNGSGKTMLMRAICGFIRPTGGEVKVWGKKVEGNHFPEDIGVLIERPGFLPEFTGMKNLHLLASIRGLITDEDIREVLRLVGLDPDLKLPVKKYSLGMKQRLGIAQALMEKPRLLILDEPTNALDSDGVQDVHRILKQLKSEGVTILMSSHHAEDIEALCDEVFRIEKGMLTQVEKATC